MKCIRKRCGRWQSDRRAPHGARGLKYEKHGRIAVERVVAPHTGRVD